MAERKNLTDANVEALEPRPGANYQVWDSKLPGLCVRVTPTRNVFYFVYSFSGRVRWYKIGRAEMGAAAAKTMARELIGDVARGRDPQAERKAKRGGSTFDEVADRYRDEHAKVHNKSWRQAGAAAVLA